LFGWFRGFALRDTQRFFRKLAFTTIRGVGETEELFVIDGEVAFSQRGSPVQLG
jgi:hypothetical protein